LTSITVKLERVITDHYEALGVARIASRDEIHRAFLRLAGRHNRDLNKEPDAEARFMEISEAHDVLFDPARRSAYDFQVWKSPG
jgi:curved DNA-binding protein CbpA